MDSTDLQRERSDSEQESDEAEAILRADAERLGIPYNEYCKRFGILGPSQRRQIRRKEAPLEEENV